MRRRLLLAAGSLLMAAPAAFPFLRPGGIAHGMAKVGLSDAGRESQQP